MVNKERILNEFAHLVSIDSQSFEERKMADYLTGCLKDLGFSVSEDAAGDRLKEIFDTKVNLTTGNIYGFLKGTAAGEPILLSAHMDTVKPGIGKAAVFHEDGRITSKGDTVLGADDLSGVVTILEALRVIKEENIPHPDIEVLFHVAEELFSLGSRVYDYSDLKAKHAYVFDLSGPVGCAANAAPSILSLEIEVKGKSSHAGFAPENGIHAIKITADAIAEIQTGWVSEDTTVNIGTIWGGTGKNIVPAECRITGEVRSMNHEKALAQADRIKQTFEKKAAQAGGHIKMTVTEEVHAYCTDKSAKVVQHFLHACEATGIEGKVQETYGGSDNNNYMLHGISGIVVACAMDNVHSCEEYTVQDELVKSAKLAVEIIRSYVEEDEHMRYAFSYGEN